MNSNNFEMLYDILDNSNIGLWAIECDEGIEPRMYINDTMRRMMDLSQDSLSPEEIYNAWYDKIDPDYHDDIQKAVDKMVLGNYAQIQYSWSHPTRNTIYFRWGGNRNFNYRQGIRLEGCLQDITEVVNIKNNFVMTQKKMAIMERQLKVAEKENQRATSKASMDIMTRVYNRAGFMEAGQEILNANRRAGILSYVMYIDMDNLKKVNDTYGHDDGDFCIINIAEQLTKVVRGRGICGRLGGDEFACVVSYRDDNFGGQFFKEQIASNFADLNEIINKPYVLSVSVGGISISPEDDINLEEALNRADEELYNEKRFKKGIK